MKKSRYTESQSIRVLKEVDAGMKVEEVCCQHGFYTVQVITQDRWRV
jgi:hypothetical protein